MRLHELVTTESERLDDAANEVWSRAELELYSRDGYDLFARRTNCIFDRVILENTPPVANYTSDLARYLAEHTPGMSVSDRRLLITSSENRDEIREPVAAVDLTPIAATVTDQATGPVPGGRLPDGTLSVLRVTWDGQPLEQETAASLRLKDSSFETREGDPQAWLWGEDGLLALRVWPAPAGDASYDDVSGDLTGDESYSDDGATIDLGSGGEWGVLSAGSDEFPSGGLWGVAGRRHPDAKNICVEITRLGRDPEVYDFELPRTFLKYIGFYAMAQALKRDGPGQDLVLAQHYRDRFDLGLMRMSARLLGVQPERQKQLGGGGGDSGALRFSLPAWWGYVGRR